MSCTGATRRYASALLAVAAASNQEGRIAFAGGVPAATTTASALRVRVGRLLDPRRDRGARLAGVPSLVSVAALVLAVVMATQVAPAVVFLDTVDVNPPAVAPAFEPSREPRPTRSTNVDAATRVLERPPRPSLTRLARPAQSEPPETAAHPFEGAALDPQPAAPLDSRVIAAHGTAPVVAAPLPSVQLAALGSAPAPAAPWAGVRTSTTSAAGDVARAAAAIGARARSAGLSIGRFMTRVSKAGANAF